MSDGATPPVAASPPDPNRAGADALPRVGLLLRIVHQLVVYGTNLITSLRQGETGYRRARAMMAFGTKDIALIIARITCGLQRAAAFQARLNVYVEKGRDLPPPALPRVRAAAAAAAAAAVRPVRNEVLALLPSAEEIAQQVRTRRLGTVIGDICRDLGLTPGLIDGVLWEQLMDAARTCGIDLTGFIRNGIRPLFGDRDAHLEIANTVWEGGGGGIAASGLPP